MAGGLSPRLFAGSLVASRRIVDDAGEAPRPDEALLARAVAAGAAAATLVTVSRPVVAASAKAELARAIGANVRGDDSAAVDMESAAWSRVAAARGIPFLAVRAISDRFDEDLPGVSRGLRRRGRRHPARRGGAACAHASGLDSRVVAHAPARRSGRRVLAEFLRTLLAADIS